MHRTSQAYQQLAAAQNTPGQCLGQKVVICGSRLWAAGCRGCMYVLHHSEPVTLVGAKCV